MSKKLTRAIILMWACAIGLSVLPQAMAYVLFLIRAALMLLLNGIDNMLTWNVGSIVYGLLSICLIWSALYILNYKEGE